MSSLFFLFFFFNDTATTEIYTLSLHDALPICLSRAGLCAAAQACGHGVLAKTVDLSEHLLAFAFAAASASEQGRRDRKSTRLNSSHSQISYAVFCLKKKKRKKNGCTIVLESVY